MQIVDHTSLQTAVTEYLALDQDTTLIARIPSFIQLAEANWRAGPNGSFAVADANSATIPRGWRKA